MDANFKVYKSDMEKHKDILLMKSEKNELDRIWVWTTVTLAIAIVTLIVLLVTSKDTAVV